MEPFEFKEGIKGVPVGHDIALFPHTTRDSMVNQCSLVVVSFVARLNDAVTVSFDSLPDRRLSRAYYKAPDVTATQ